MVMKSKIGQRGKDTERAVADHLEALNAQHMDFAFERLPDSRAARNLIKAQLCDFIASHCGAFFMIEAKQTQHDSRLESAKIGQLARMRKWQTTGATGIIIVYHSRMNAWRAFDLRKLEGCPPSWDLDALKIRCHNRLAEALLAETNLPPLKGPVRER